MKNAIVVVAVWCVLGAVGIAQSSLSDLYKTQPGTETRWASFENLAAAKGAGGKENRGGKGHAFDTLAAGEMKTLLDVRGPGSIRRMWFTIRERDPQMLRALRLEMFWDGARSPAVSVPFGDFFGAILGRTTAFENELFANPEGRSFNCYVPMPFAKSARVTLTNESSRNVSLLFYDIDFLLTPKADPEALYFHAWWHRDPATRLGRDFEILPNVNGHGRFLGAHLGVMGLAGDFGWFGEGEVKMYLDGDTEFPTIVGTGTEDYIGTGWGQGVFHGRYQGGLIADEPGHQYAFYRYHIPDPVFFRKNARITIQQMGGAEKKLVLQMQKQGVPMEPVSIADDKFVKLLEGPPVDLAKDASPDSAWVNIYRSQDVSAVALFYLDTPENGLPKLQPVAERVARMEEKGK